MKTVAIVQARLGSSRLPRKALMEIAGQPMIQHVVDRVREVAGLYAIIIVTPDKDHGLINQALRRYKANEIPDYLKSWPHLDDADVLSRYARAAADIKPDVIVRVTGDCPLWNPRIAEQVLALYKADPAVEYASNIAPGYVDGEDVEVFSRAALERAHREATDPHDREHVTPFMRRHVACTTLQPETSTPKQKTSVDTLEDLERVRALLEALATCEVVRAM